jgi:PAS domain S-box-containing protein
VSGRRVLSVRAVLALLAGAVALYIVVVGGLIALQIAPAARALSAHSQAVLREHSEIRRRLDALAGSISAVHEAILQARAGDPLDVDEATRLTAPVRAQLDNVVGVDVSARLAAIPAEMRTTLAAAARAEQNAAGGVIEAIAALAVGRTDVAIERLTEADHGRTATARHLDAAQYLAIADVAERERELLEAARATNRIILWWGVFGAALFAIGAVIVQRRLYRPLAELESSLENVTAGDLTTTVPVRRLDELGRLGGHFNRMTRVLRERAEEERRRREDLAEQFGDILAESPGEIVLFEEDTMRIVRATRGARLALGYGADELRERTLLDLWTRLGRDELDEALAPLRAGEGARVRLSTVQTRRDGSTYPVEVTVHLSSVAQPPVFVAFILDLSAWERAHALSTRLRDFALQKGRVIGGGDLPRALAEITRAAAETLGVERAAVWRLEGDRGVCLDLYEHSTGRHSRGQELEGLERAGYFDALDQGRTIAAHDACADARTGALVQGYLAPAGITSLLAAPVRVAGHLVAVLANEHVGEQRRWSAEEQAFAASMADLVAIAFEASERSRAQDALLASEARYRAAFEEAGVGIAEVDLEGRILRANRALGEMLGMADSALAGRSVVGLLHPDDREADVRAGEAVLRGNAPVARRETRWLRADGGAVWTSVTSALVHSADGSGDHLVSVVEDVTERRALQAQLAHDQRMESIGRLAGGIAHDFNNLLTAIGGYVDLALQGLPESEPLAQDLREVERAAERGSELTRQLLTFARRQVVEPRAVDVDELVRSVSRLLARLLGERIELELDLDAEPDPVVADPGQLEQVIINLAVNARDAMPAGGRLTLRTRTVELDGAWAERHAGCVPGRYTRLSVEDTGAGMDAETLSQIFEPFFTTKDSGRGTGLGLATSYGIVRQAGGEIEAFSEAGAGTTIQVHLPIRPPTAAVRPPEPRSRAAAVQRGEGRLVLVVDDEPQVRALMERALRRQGFEVLGAGNAEEGERLFREHPRPIDLLVTDVILPGRGGLDLAGTLRRLRPELPVLYVSGYAESQVEHTTLLAEGDAFLPKPFTASELTARAAELLARSPAPDV